jgi:hypothetical protein
MPILSKQSRSFGYMPSLRERTEGVGFEPTVLPSTPQISVLPMKLNTEKQCWTRVHVMQ